MRAGLQTQPADRPTYAGPFDAMRRIWASHGIAGIYKGQVATLIREASGYGVYFWAYERLVRRELATNGGRREDVSPVKAVLFGAAAGYAVRLAFAHAASARKWGADRIWNSCGRSSTRLT